MELQKLNIKLIKQFLGNHVEIAVKFILQKEMIHLKKINLSHHRKIIYLIKINMGHLLKTMLLSLVGSFMNATKQDFQIMR